MAFHCDSQNVLFAIGSAFLYYVNHFKLYSLFCASHSKAQKVLHPSEYFPHIIQHYPQYQSQSQSPGQIIKFIYIHQQGDSRGRNINAKESSHKMQGNVEKIKLQLLLAKSKDVYLHITRLKVKVSEKNQINMYP